MNLDAVRAFVAVAEEGQFQHAGSVLGLSQQAVSKRVAALEASLGVTLFRRVAAGASLTADGRTFLPHGRALLLAAKQARESVQRETRPLRVDLLNDRIASSTLLEEFHRVHPGVALETVALGSGAASVRALLDGEIDAAFGYPRGLAADSGIARLPACLEVQEIAAGERHPLGTARSVGMSELAGVMIWVPGIVEGSEWGAYYEELAEAFSLTIDATGPSFGLEALLETVSDSRSLVTFVGDRTRLVWLSHQRLRRVPVVGPAPAYPWSLLWHPASKHEGLAALVAHVRRNPPRISDDVWLPSDPGWAA
ncbi:LysR family transcriptional regulator [Kribbella sp. DT2]|uniref:LysR family transcriptional regulator n=1 Tax=Kribbella sp. DT2 TaxID=3393427 RepID=UPI003CE87FB9